MGRLVAFGTLLLSVACGGEEQPAGPDTTQPVVASVEVSPTEQTFTAIGKTQQFTATAKDASGATISGKSFNWSSSNTPVATVNSSSGLATTTGDGVRGCHG